MFFQRHALILLFDVTVFLLGIIGIHFLALKASLPFDVDVREGSLVATKILDPVLLGLFIRVTRVQTRVSRR